MRWQTITILVIMLGYLVYGIRTVILIRRINLDMNATDDLKDQKIKTVKNDARLWFFCAVFVIIGLYLSLLI